MPKAISGPSMAPTLSIARCTPNEVASRSLALESEIRASRGSGADPLADAVDGDDRADAADRVAGRDQGHLAQGREPVAEPGHLLVAAPAVGGEAAGDLDQRRGAAVGAVDRAEDQRAGAEAEDEVHRQDRRHHLRGDVRQQADGAEHDHVARHPQAGGAARPEARLQQGFGGFYLVHGFSDREPDRCGGRPSRKATRQLVLFSHFPPRPGRIGQVARRLRRRPLRRSPSPSRRSAGRGRSGRWRPGPGPRRPARSARSAARSRCRSWCTGSTSFARCTVQSTTSSRLKPGAEACQVVGEATVDGLVVLALLGRVRVAVLRQVDEVEAVGVVGAEHLGRFDRAGDRGRLGDVDRVVGQQRPPHLDDRADAAEPALGIGRQQVLVALGQQEAQGGRLQGRDRQVELQRLALQLDPGYGAVLGQGQALDRQRRCAPRLPAPAPAPPSRRSGAGGRRRCGPSSRRHRHRPRGRRTCAACGPRGRSPAAPRGRRRSASRAAVSRSAPRPGCRRSAAARSRAGSSPASRRSCAAGTGRRTSPGAGVRAGSAARTAAGRRRR